MEIKAIKEQTLEMSEQLKEKRERWEKRLETEREKNEMAIAPLAERTTQIQTKVDRLRLRKDELEHSLHPEKYAAAIADFGKMEVEDEGNSESSGGVEAKEAAAEDQALPLADTTPPKRPADSEAKEHGEAPAVKIARLEPAGDTVDSD